MPSLIWSPPALLDVQRIYRFMSAKTIDGAKRAIRIIHDGVKIIATHPGVGRPADDIEPEYREWLIGLGDRGYIILYRYDGQTAIIMAVRHQNEAGFLPH